MSITTALKARREALRNREDGFTLIELLVVVIIIGILAAIAIPIYIGVQNNAKDSAVKQDLTSNKNAIAAYATDNSGNIPTASTEATLATALASYSWVKSTPSTASFTYSQSSGSFCLLGTSATGNTFYISTNKSVTAASACPASSAW